MRIDVSFREPVQGARRLEAALAVAVLVKSRSLYWLPGGWGAVIHGESMGRERVDATLREAGLPVEAVRSSLIEEEDEASDETAASRSARERLRPIGR